MLSKKKIFTNLYGRSPKDAVKSRAAEKCVGPIHDIGPTENLFYVFTNNNFDRHCINIIPGWKFHAVIGLGADMNKAFEFIHKLKFCQNKNLRYI